MPNTLEELWTGSCTLHDHEVLTTEEVRKIAERLYSGYELALVLETIDILELQPWGNDDAI